ncbi:MAG: ATP-binding protein, partial [Muribaculaceae bacterium]|nr:ATP-binding protein [Muribaculaceae bacterium]
MRKLELQKVDKTKQKESACKASPKSVLEAFEYIVELSENSNLDKDFFEKASKHIKYATRKLQLTSMQVVLLAQFVDRSQNSRIMMSDIAEYVGCRTTRFLRMADDIDSLEAKYYLRASRSKGSVSYRVSPEVLKSIRTNQPYVHVKENVYDTQSFFDKFNVLMEEKEDNELTHDNLCVLTLEMLDEIKQSHFACKIKSCQLDESDTVLFIFMAHLFVENNDDNIGFHDLENLFDDDKLPRWVKRSFRNRTSELFEEKLIENVNEDGMARSDSFKLTNYAKEEVLSELDLNSIGKSENGLIAYDTLAEKELIYNESEQNQISELSSILSKDRFNDVQSRLEKAGMRKGFCCLFYGGPGTGKTETVYQLARHTGRNIMRVDVDKIKSCWVGESEKNIKALFDRYRNICKNSTIAPILLFNEADAVLGVRMEGASRAVDKMENSIQNIILQEMETLEGILIATTNLTTNLD